MPYFHHFLSESLTYNNKTSTSTNSLIKPIKQGYLLLHYKKRLFGRGWRQEFVVLYEDSSLVWMRDQHRLEVDGRIMLREAPDLIAASQWVSRVPQKPEPPFDKVEWFICKSNEDLTEWMTCINSTLPAPPPPPLAELKRIGVDSDYDMSKFRCHKSEDSTLYSLSNDFTKSVLVAGHIRPHTKRRKSLSCRELSMTGTGDDDAVHLKPTGEGPSSHKKGKRRKESSSKSRIPVQPIGTGFIIGGIIAGSHWSMSDWGWGMGWGWNLCDDCCALQQQDMVHPPPVFYRHTFGVWDEGQISATNTMKITSLNQTTKTFLNLRSGAMTIMTAMMTMMQMWLATLVEISGDSKGASHPLVSLSFHQRVFFSSVYKPCW
ncbi:unnamed protein product [Lepeophtheirus salmonis]|uniref:(salmon louse) hypothetical protein n=1 Tax=Lepeophtheirus salmonis TaxID=72036 RepID=A0A7R8CF19_LEPSM|nr:unnamed protein product [Lepeophtheirus salmonis]CAF2797017.1 unnamed protein product [Lepeophtheirus salmonis]